MKKLVKDAGAALSRVVQVTKSCYNDSTYFFCQENIHVKILATSLSFLTFYTFYNEEQFLTKRCQFDI